MSRRRRLLFPARIDVSSSAENVSVRSKRRRQVACGAVELAPDRRAAFRRRRRQAAHARKRGAVIAGRTLRDRPTSVC